MKYTFFTLESIINSARTRLLTRDERASRRGQRDGSAIDVFARLAGVWVKLFLTKDRGTLLPRKLDEPLQDQIKEVRRIHDQDLKAGHGAVYLPFALDRKYPAAPKEFGWQQVHCNTGFANHHGGTTEFRQRQGIRRN
ncbi:MAG: hypothetical protein WCS52_11880 [bacterium]